MTETIFAIGGLGTTELIAIAVVIFLLFGATRLPQLAKALGQASPHRRRCRRPATPMNLTLNLPNGTQDLKLDEAVPVSLAGWNTHLEDVALFETPIGADGRPALTHHRGKATAVRESRWPEAPSSRCVRQSARLSPDASYRLVVRGWRLPRRCRTDRTGIERETRFTTVGRRCHEPRPAVREAEVGQPLQIQWDAPIADVRYEVTPPTPIKAAIDPNTRQLSTVVLENPDDGQTYKIMVADARGANGIALSPWDRVHRCRARAPEAAGGRRVADGRAWYPLHLRFSTPIERVKLEFEPAVKPIRRSTAKTRPRDGEPGRAGAGRDLTR